LTSDDASSASQVFEYDAQTQAMVHVSVGEHGYNDNGLAFLEFPGSPYFEGNSVEEGGTLQDQFFSDSNDAVLARKTEAEATFSPSSYVDHLSVSQDGSYVFFTSPIALAPHALNRALLGVTSITGTPQAEFAQNVYEYHDGDVSLISDGQDNSSHGGVSQVHLLTTDLSGRDVFFETVDPLVLQDTDSNKDVYDARIGGGFANPTAPQECEGDGCQGGLSPAPVLLSPGSEFQAGGGNLAPAPKVTTKAKVVAKKKPKAKKPKAKKKKKKKTAAKRASTRDKHLKRSAHR
jgi:hypothetical protein